MSEWAVHCAECGADLAGSVLVPPPASGTDSEPQPRTAARPSGPRHGRLWLGLSSAGIVAVAVVAFAGVQTHGGSRSTTAAKVPPRPVLAPVALRNYSVLYTGPLGPRLVPLHGETPITLLRSGPGDPQRPLAVSGGVVFLHRGLAYFYDTAAPERFHALVPADRLFPMIWPGVVGVQRGLEPGPLSVQFVSTSEARTADSPVWQLPAGYQPIAQGGTGLFVINTIGQLRTWSLETRQLGPVLGLAASVVDTHVDQVAWRASMGCADGECPMHLTNASTGQDRIITPPAEHRGFFDGGAFSPDGATLAAFVIADAPNNSPGAALVLIDTANGTTTLVAHGTVPIGEPIGMAAWPPDAATVFFCGNNGTMHVYRLATRGVLTINLPASYSFAVW